MKNKSFIQIFILLIFTSCGIPYSEKTDQGYYQFTPNDLSHFYIDKDSLTFTEGFYYKDSIAFLLNSRDTIFAEVQTYVHSWPSDNKYFPDPLVATSQINFKEPTGFRYFYCQVTKNDDGDYSSKYIGVGLINDNQYYGCYLESEVDTTTVLDSLYQNVYKIDLIESATNNIKSIYFAKKFGFIKVENYDGKKIELIELYHKGIYYIANKN